MLCPPRPPTERKAHKNAADDKTGRCNRNPAQTGSDNCPCSTNIGLDYEWFGVDAGQRAAADRIQKFLIDDCRKDSYHIYELDGRVIDEKALHPFAITATTAQGSLAAQGELAKEWVEIFWNMPLRTGDRRYYDNCLYIFAFLALSGNYRIW